MTLGHGTERSPSYREGNLPSLAVPQRKRPRRQRAPLGQTSKPAEERMLVGSLHIAQVLVFPPFVAFLMSHGPRALAVRGMRYSDGRRVLGRRPVADAGSGVSSRRARSALQVCPARRPSN